MVEKLKFAHIADLHLGAWRESRLTRLNFETFQKTVDFIIKENFDFVLFVGDIFNNAMPNLDLVLQVIEELKKLKKENIPVYIIAGSHDYSNSDKGDYLSLLEKIDLVINVAKTSQINKKELELVSTVNHDLKLNLCGISGKKKGLDKSIYSNLREISMNKNYFPDYFNLFLFHCSLDDFKPSYMKNAKIELRKEFLPKKFDYYAGGHIHSYMLADYSGKPISYSGCLFPNNFFEIINEKPGFNICEYDFSSKDLKISRKEIQVYNKEYIKIEFNNETSIEARNKILERLEGVDVVDKIILLHLSGIVEGRISDIQLNNIISKLYEDGTFIVLKNTYKLSNSKLGNIEVVNENDVEKIESEIVRINLEDSKSPKKDFEIISEIFSQDFKKIEGEKNVQYEDRIISIFDKIREEKL